MPGLPPRSRRIRILRDEVSRKIAAGEVIDRPSSIVRELLDNAIDAGASAIDVLLEAGGLQRLRVVDDGAGMGRQDLEVCWKPHATSKIESEDDLLRVSTLGFRGEALSSIAVCSRLSITTCQTAGEPAHRLEVLGGALQGVEVCEGRQGTIVDVRELFFNFPARKKFLRSVSAESALCRSIFLDRALAHPGVSFRLFVDGEVKLSLPQATQRERIALCYQQQLDPRMLVESDASGDGFTVRVTAALPDLRRRDRKLIQVFVNRRRVTEYSLMQALEYGFSGFVPGGWYPIAFAFVDIDPALIDFNIHPAKKEVRFRSLPEVHATVVAAVRAALASSQQPRSGPAPTRAPAPAAPRSNEAGARGIPSLLPVEKLSSAPRAQTEGIRFLGQIFGVFLVFELSHRLLIMDQHAAHERLIFERLASRAPKLQEMLFPLSFDVSEEEEGRIAATAEELPGVGIQVKRVGSRSFEITAISDDLRPLREDVLVELVRAAGGKEWRDALRATAACRLAIKEGDAVDPVTAVELCAQALRLTVPRCPHGRPIWHELQEETLRRLVDRPPAPASQ